MIPPPAVYAAAFAPVMTACGLPDIGYETEHLRVGTQFDEPLCRGTLDHLESVVTTLEMTLGTSVERPIEVSRESSVNPGWCADDTARACHNDGAVYSDLDSLEHELVHAVVATMGDPAPFWSEGTAVALESERTLFGLVAPLDDLDAKDSFAVNYRSAGHFSRWLQETHGLQRYRELLRAKGSAREVFEQTYDFSLADAQAQFYAEAPYSYGVLVACEHPELEQSGDLSWSETFDVDCDAADIHSTERGMGAFRVLTITQRGHYAFSTTAQLGTLARCDDEDLDLPIANGDPAYGDISPIDEAFIHQYVQGFAGDESVIYDLVPGRYEVAVGFLDFQTRTATLDVRAAQGPIPQTPGLP